MLSKVLENLGLNAKEAKVYLATLEIGSNPVSKIAGKAKINRVTAYDIIEKLAKKGLISSFTRAKVKYFTATDPDVLVTDFQRKVGELKEALPELQRLTGETVHPRVRYFEGADGIRHIYEDTLTSKTEILNYGDSEEIRTHWPTYDQDYVAKRAGKNIFLRGVTLDDDYGRRVVEGNTDYKREIRLISKDKFNFSNEICIYDDKVAIISFKDELIGMIIESPEIANTQRAIFSMVWEFSRGTAEHVREHSPLNGLKASDIIGKKVIEEMAEPATAEQAPEPEPTEMEATTATAPEPVPTESTETETYEEPTAAPEPETPPQESTAHAETPETLPEDLEEPPREHTPPKSDILNHKEQIQLF